MIIAIYDRPGSFSDRWIEESARLGIDARRVDIFRTDLFPYLAEIGAHALLMHPPMTDRRSALAARAIIEAAQASGMQVFPSPQDFRHFDDKLAQKYLFEALGIPSPTTYAFFCRTDASQWASSAEYPIVFKLRAGAGAVNVELVRSRARLEALIGRMFGRGVHSTNAAIRDIRTKVRTHSRERSWLGALRRAPKTLLTLYRDRRDIDVERGYVYLQQFLPGNAWDTRITVIGKRAFGFRRLVRPGDFRASGSGSIEYDPGSIDIRAVEQAFIASRRLRSSCMAFDFVEDLASGRPLVVEMSFAFKSDAVYGCPGHWNERLEWQPGSVWPEHAILQDLARRKADD